MPSRTLQVGKRPQSRSIAIVSGKGGSGKTMVAVSLAQGAARGGEDVILIDTDFATGGLTHYLTFRQFYGARTGLTDLLSDPKLISEMDQWTASGNIETADDRWLSVVRLVPIGDQRKISDEPTEALVATVAKVIDVAKRFADFVIVDCRGGIDRQSLAVCGNCDEVLMVVETDTTSIQASQHLIDVLAENGLRKKVAGFVLNKVMDDPSALAKAATSLLRTDYLGAIPFDIEATRSYIQGKIPSSTTLFARHCFAILPWLDDRLWDYRRIRTLSPSEYGQVTLRSPEARYGALVIAMAAVTVIVAAAFSIWAYGQPSSSGFDIDLKATSVTLTIAFSVTVFAALSENVKAAVGKVILAYRNMLGRVLGGLR